MDMQDIEKALLEIIPGFAVGLPPEQVKEMEELVRAGEVGIAFENLCTQLYEYDVPVPQVVRERLALIGNTMEISRSYWERLGVE